MEACQEGCLASPLSQEGDEEVCNAFCECTVPCLGDEDCAENCLTSLGAEVCNLGCLAEGGDEETCSAFCKCIRQCGDDLDCREQCTGP